MKKILLVLFLMFSFVTMSGFSAKEEDEVMIDNLDRYNKEFKTEDIEVCSTSATKTYMSYKAVTSTRSRQYRFIHSEMTVDEVTGLLYDEDGFIGVALGSNFGEIGTRYYFTLDTGIVLPVVKVDAKASVDAPNGCSHSKDASVIEFVIDSEIAGEFFGVGGNVKIVVVWWEGGNALAGWGGVRDAAVSVRGEIRVRDTQVTRELGVISRGWNFREKR